MHNPIAAGTEKYPNPYTRDCPDPGKGGTPDWRDHVFPTSRHESIAIHQLLGGHGEGHLPLALHKDDLALVFEVCTTQVVLAVCPKSARP